MTILKCKKGFILRKSYRRKSYTRKNGTKVKSKYIKAKCIKSRGAPGKTSNKFKTKGIPPLKKGELTKYGYHNVKSLGVRKRRRALTSAIKEYGASKVLRKLGVLRTYHKRTFPSLSSKYYDNMKWTRKKFNNQFKGDWTKSALYKA